MDSSETEQEAFWRAEFGNEYVDRNQGAALVAANLALFGRMLQRTAGIGRILELGCNIGLNLVALRQLLPQAHLTAVEINAKAVSQVRARLPDAEIHHGSILDFTPAAPPCELVFTKGVLIHLNPDKLPQVYDLMHASSTRYLLVCEYYNPRPVEVEYRGHSGRLFKRDFAGELMDRFPDLRLLDYGFVYHRASTFPQDDLTWFLLEKQR